MSEIKLPELGEGISSVEISDVLINIGDTLKIDDPMIVVKLRKPPWKYLLLLLAL